MNKILSENKNIKNYDKVLMLVAFVMAYLLFSHPDLWETANHSYVFLESIFNGRVFDFYTFVAEHTIHITI